MWYHLVLLAAAVAAAEAVFYRTQAAPQGGDSIPCEQARLKCAYRMGCGKALQNYMMGCSAVLDNPNPKHCPDLCQHSLIALTSTVEGKALMNCKCSDKECEDQKRRSEVCRPVVEKATNQPVLNCSVAHTICTFDSQCSTALDYYNRYCKAMFDGRKCTRRCKNSISILTRQEKAKKLATCRCEEGDYQCSGIRRHMDKLCFGKHKHQKIKLEEEAAVAETVPPPPAVVPSVVLASTSSASSIGPGVLVMLVLWTAR